MSRCFFGAAQWSERVRPGPRWKEVGSQYFGAEKMTIDSRFKKSCGGMNDGARCGGETWNRNKHKTSTECRTALQTYYDAIMSLFHEHLP